MTNDARLTDRTYPAEAMQQATDEIKRLRALLTAEPTEAEVEAAAEAMHEWDTLNRPWVSVTPVVKNMWLDAARVGLKAAREARR